MPVLAYSTALLAMSLVALDSGSRRTAAGGVLFLVSDTLLALERFGGIHLPAHEGLVMAYLHRRPGAAGRSAARLTYGAVDSPGQRLRSAEQRRRPGQAAPHRDRPARR